MAEVAYREDSLGGRGLGWLTSAAQRPGSTTIADILELNAEAIGIAQVELRCAFLGATRIGTAHSHPRLHGAWVALGHAMSSKGLCDARDAETIDGHTKVGYGRFNIGTSLGQADVLRARPDAEANGDALAMLDGHPEEALVELHRPFPVRNREGQVIE
jgi:hypothetical protein